MKTLKKLLLGGSMAALILTAGNTQLMAQGRGNFDPAQFKQMRIDRAKEELEVKDDDWKAIEPLVAKVVDAETDVMAMRMRGSFGRRNRSSDSTSSSSDSQRQRRSPFGEPSQAVTDLQKAIDEKAPAAELKAKLAAVRAETKDKEAKLDAAQEDLRGVLTARQEAIAVVHGLLK